MDVPRSPLDQWQMLPTTGIPEGEKIQRVRLNSLCSLYYFAKVVLGRNRLTWNLHEPICRLLHQKRLKLVLEIPRDHYKSTICTEAFPMWRTLRMRVQDANFILNIRGESGRLLYGGGFVNYLSEIHNPNECWLIANESLDNAVRLMGRAKQHYESNRTFRSVFDDMLPKACKAAAGRYDGRWADKAFSVNRDDRGRGEATFECIGVGGAVQSRHYDGGVIQDDLVGKAAFESEAVMDKTIEWHRLLAGVFDSGDKEHSGNEIIVGNRWSFSDLNSWVRENEPWFTFITRSAIEDGVPILPEQFSLKKLMDIKQRQGTYIFSAQYLNSPAAPEDADFKEEWLCHYEFYDHPNHGLTIRHLGEFAGHKDYPDVPVAALARYMVVDPNHAGALGKARHAIVATGVSDRNRKYVLETWAKAVSHETMIDQLFTMAARWGVYRVHCEAIGAQKLLMPWVNQKAEKERKFVRLEPLAGYTESLAGGLTNIKTARIVALTPAFQRREVFVQQSMMDFLQEYTTFPKGKYCDIMDALAYGPMLWQAPMSMEEVALMQQRQRLANMGRSSRTGY